MKKILAAAAGVGAAAGAEAAAVGTATTVVAGNIDAGPCIDTCGVAVLDEGATGG